MQVNDAPPQSVPALAAPGAGLPPIELFFARLIFRGRSALTSREGAEALIAAERQRIEMELGLCTQEDVARRVLIARPTGLEDSSRHWSVLMVLDHLRIVNSAIAGTIDALLAGRLPPGTASTAAVKPSPEVGPEVIDEFRRECDRLSAAGAGAATLVTSVRYAHPWFGPLTAAEWKFLGGFHLGLHRRQIGMILTELRRSRADTAT